jgi:formylglycine-generating enzyme required for sulfatase activity
MTDYADVEVRLSRSGPGVYEISSRYKRAGSVSDRPLTKHKPLMHLDVKEMRQYELNVGEYGRKLAGALFEDEALSDAFERVRNLAEHDRVQLRTRFFIDHDAPELHQLRWETIRDPNNMDVTLFTRENVLCSRYLFSSDWRRVERTSQAAARALVVIADTGDNVEGLKPVNVIDELKRARESLRPISMTALASGGKANLEQIKHALRGGYDIFYLVCHGILLEDEPTLYLETPSGEPHPVSGGELVNFLDDLPHRPNLLVLASCESSGTGRTGDNGVLSALGPRLAEAGIPAVVAMQGNVQVKTVERFMPAFFTEMQRDGQIDRAIAAARSLVKSEGLPDWWAPVLLTRFDDGRLWSAEAGPIWQPIEPEMIRVAGGKFTIGSEPRAGIPGHETPAAEIHLPDYWISKSPITNGEFTAFFRRVREYHDFWSEVGKRIGAPPGWDDDPRWTTRWSARQLARGKDRSEPVQGVTWFEAVAYCEWLKRETGKEYTLPTEAQWEKAAKQNNGALIHWGELREWTRTLWGVRRPTPDAHFQYPYPADDEARNMLDAGHLLYRVYRGKGDADEGETRPETRGAFLPYHRGPTDSLFGFRVVFVPASADDATRPLRREIRD